MQQSHNDADLGRYVLWLHIFRISTWEVQIIFSLCEKSSLLKLKKRLAVTSLCSFSMQMIVWWGGDCLASRTDGDIGLFGGGWLGMDEGRFWNIDVLGVSLLMKPRTTHDCDWGERERIRAGVGVDLSAWSTYMHRAGRSSRYTTHWGPSAWNSSIIRTPFYTVWWKSNIHKVTISVSRFLTVGGLIIVSQETNYLCICM